MLPTTSCSLWLFEFGSGETPDLVMKAWRYNDPLFCISYEKEKYIKSGDKWIIKIIPKYIFCATSDVFTW